MTSSVIPSAKYSFSGSALRLRNGVVQRQDVGMIQPGGDRDLTQKPVGTEQRRQLGPQHLDRDGAAVLHVVREVHRCHAAAAQLALDPVAVRERNPEAGNRIGHRWLPKMRGILGVTVPREK